jgi:hypothetical protein
MGMAPWKSSIWQFLILDLMVAMSKLTNFLDGLNHCHAVPALLKNHQRDIHQNHANIYMGVTMLTVRDMRKY